MVLLYQQFQVKQLLQIAFKDRLQWVWFYFMVHHDALTQEMHDQHEPFVSDEQSDECVQLLQQLLANLSRSTDWKHAVETSDLLRRCHSEGNLVSWLVPSCYR